MAKFSIQKQKSSKSRDLDQSLYILCIQGTLINDMKLFLSYRLAILLICLLSIRAGTNNGKTSREQIVKDVESTLLFPALQGLFPELVGRWKLAVATCQSDEEILATANAIAAEYHIWNQRRERAVANVINDAYIGTYMTSHVDFSTLEAFSTLTKNSSLSVDKDLCSRYMKTAKVDWYKLISNIVKCDASQRGLLIKFARKHWPKSDKKRDAFYANEKVLCQNHWFKLALSIQSIETLQYILRESESNHLKGAAQEALNNKL